jgi:hypothetical protein
MISASVRKDREHQKTAMHQKFLSSLENLYASKGTLLDPCEAQDWDCISANNLWKRWMATSG